MTDMEEFSTPSYPSGDITLLTVEIVRNRVAIGELVAALKGGIELATNAHVYWDADQDAKVGKHLIALSGGLKGYDARSDAIHAAIAKHDTSTTTTKEQ